MNKINTPNEIHRDIKPLFDNKNEILESRNIEPWTQDQQAALLLIKYRCDKKSEAHLEQYHYFRKLSVIFDQTLSIILLIAGSASFSIIIAYGPKTLELIPSVILLLAGIAVQISSYLDYNSKKEKEHKAYIGFKNISSKIEQEMLLIQTNDMRPFDQILYEINTLYIKEREEEVPLPKSLLKKHNILTHGDKYTSLVNNLPYSPPLDSCDLTDICTKEPHNKSNILLAMEEENKNFYRSGGDS